MENLYNPRFEKRGYIQIYTGDGKGKTTASIGLAVRALGRGMKVLIMHFCKVKHQTGEYKQLSKMLDNLDYESCGLPHYPTKGGITNEDKKAFDEGWHYVIDNHLKYDMIILDELNIAVDFSFITPGCITQFLLGKPKHQEIVITGRNAHPELIAAAHLVTDMYAVKHYWNCGVRAREGIEF